MMKRIALSLIAVAAVTAVAAWAQTPTRPEVKPATPSAKEIRGASP